MSTQQLLGPPVTLVTFVLDKEPIAYPEPPCGTVAAMAWHHPYSLCLGPYPAEAKTVAEAAAWMIQNKSGKGARHGYGFSMEMEDAVRDGAAALIAELLAAKPDIPITVGMYTARARKRRGAHTRQRKLLRIRQGATTHYIGGVHYNGDAFTVSAETITVPCHCGARVSPSRVPAVSVWPRPA
ncbi:MAG TPA: hypothetical protein VJM32_03930 [Candidatus Saccharimonadales bacterium]|nr:hypothetical protein [Candidatus Saccharimonadales bacterium]